MLLDKCLLDKVLGGEMHQPSYSFWCKAGDDMVTNIFERHSVHRHCNLSSETKINRSTVKVWSFR